MHSHWVDRLLFLSLFIFTLLFYSPSLSAQPTGTVSGTVTASGQGEPLPGANVFIAGTAIGTSTDSEGRYVLKNVPSGTQTISFTYLGFESVSKQITVITGQLNTLDVSLMDNFVELQGITVSGIRQGQATALNQQKTAANIKNVVASDLIGRFPDQNVADALRRIPAITIQQDQGEARYVQIRGTNPNLSNVSINGEQIPSPEGDVRFVAMDMIPNDILSSIEVSKAITPDMDGDAIGGSVNLKTLSAPNRQILRFTLAPGYNNNAKDLSAIGGLGSFTYGNRIADGKLGFILSGSYNRANRGSNNNEMEYDSGDIEALELRDYELTRERLGTIASIDYQFNSQSKLFLNSAFNYFTDTEYRRRLTIEPDALARELKDRLEKQKIFSLSAGGEHALSSSWSVDYMGSYSYADQNTPYDRNVVFEQAYEDVFTGDDVEIMEFGGSDPDYPQFTTTTEGVLYGADAYDYDAFEFDEFEESSENTSDQNITGRLNLHKTYGIGDIVGELSFGGLYRTKEKKTSPNIKLYGYDGDFLYSDVQGSFEDDDFLDGKYPNGIGLFPDPDKLEGFFNNNRASFDAEFEDEDSESDSKSETFSATENTFAGYLMSDFRKGKLSGLAGVRYEATSVEYTANNVEFDDSGDLLPITESNGSKDYNFVLPMVHLTYEVTPLTNLRAAWTNSFAKPNYFDLAPYRIINREDQEIELGNPELDATTSMNFDLMGEYYFNSLGVISAGLFYKKISNFIYITTYDFDESGPYFDYEAVQPVNGSDADLAGFEFNLQQQLTFLPGFASGFGLYANYTYSWSEAELTSESGDVRTISLPGQAENTGNLALSYEKSGFSGRISLSYAGSFIDEIRETSDDDRIYDEHIQIDFSASQRITPNLTVFLELINLTNEPLRYYNGVTSRPEQQEFYSFWGNAGIKFEL